MGSSITIIYGNVGQIGDLKVVGEDTVCNFSVAVSRGENSPTTWFNVAAWNRLADISSKYIQKGMRVQVTGYVSARGYIGQDGSARASLDLRASDIQLPGKSEASSDSSNNESDDYTYSSPPPADGNNDIPF